MACDKDDPEIRQVVFGTKGYISPPGGWLESLGLRLHSGLDLIIAPNFFCSFGRV